MSDNFYERKQIITERVQLAEDIILPELYDDFENTPAKFFINIFTPMLDKTKVSLQSRPAPSTVNTKGGNIESSTYEQANYITLTIPRYILLNFNKRIVPKGTEFIITCIGEFKIEHFRIIGIYTI